MVTSPASCSSAVARRAWGTGVFGEEVALAVTPFPADPAPSRPPFRVARP